MIISESGLILLTIFLIAVVPAVIVVAMLLAYEGEESIFRRVVDTILFYPLVTMFIGAYIFLVWFLIGDIGLGISSASDYEIQRWGPPLAVGTSVAYVFFFKPEAFWATLEVFVTTSTGVGAPRPVEDETNASGGDENEEGPKN